MAANNYCCQRMCHFGLSYPIFETSGWNNVTFGSQGDIRIIHSFSDFDLVMTPCDLDLFGGGGQQEDHLASN